MSNHEKSVVKPSQQVSKRVLLKQMLSVVSGMSLGDISSAESFVHKAHIAQLPNGEETAVSNLEHIVGRPVDIFIRSGQIDMESWSETGKVGEYHRSDDGTTFAYSKMVEQRGSERVIKTVAFTSMPREQVISNLGEPERPQENNVIPFPTQEELKSAA